MTKNTGLGRGFDGLIPTGMDIGEVATPGEHIKNVAINKVIPNPDQPRKTFDETAIKELAQSIKQHGIIQPLIVTPHKDKYRIVAGERRYRASQVAGLKQLPVIVRNHEKLEELEIALVENVQRVDLSPLEQAMSIVKLRDQFSLSPKEIAAKLGKAETTISNIVRLLQLPESAIEALQKNKISEGHARAILSLKPDEKQQQELLDKIIEQNLSVRQAEALSKKLKGHYVKTLSSTKKLSLSTQKLLKNVDKSLVSKIYVREKSAGVGSLNISYSNQNELEQYLKKLSR